MVVGYVPCRNNKQDSSTTYQLHHHYFINKEKVDNDPRARFCKDLMTPGNVEGRRKGDSGLS